MKEKIIAFYHSKQFKIIILILAFVYLFLTIFITIDPKPFLKFGNIGVFVFNLIGGPGMLLVPAVSRHFGVFSVAFVSALGMAFNDLLSWWVGRNVHELKNDEEGKTSKVKKMLQKYGILGLFIFAVLPAPYDYIGFIAGYLKFSIKAFLVPTFLGRFIRFFLIGLGVIVVFGRYKVSP